MRYLVQPAGASLLFSAVLFLAGCEGGRGVDAKIGFNDTIQPILSENCYGCHGPSSSSRKAGLRLDHAETAYAPHEKFGPAIVPGKPDKSPLVRRIEEKDPKERMPPPEAHKTLKPEQIALLRRWIAEGAHYEPHWAFIAPKRPSLPSVGRDDWAHDEIDRFILAKLQKEGLCPSREADRRSLIRRVTYALTGLPPTPQEVQAFLADAAPNAYEKVVDRLLESPRYGEHRAHYWLDYVRYADTHGIHYDNFRAIWPYRDYVVHAFNTNKRFDAFVREQLAGDLLPARTPDGLIATGYIRSNLTTDEAGTVPEELLVNLARDRVENFGVTFLGLTTGCAACHDHKFDPTTQKDFYQLAAMLSNTAEAAWDGNVPDPGPVLRLPDEKNRAAFEAAFAERADLQEKLAKHRQRAATVLHDWLATGHRPLPVSTDKLELRLRLDEAHGDEVRNSAPTATPATFKANPGPLLWGEQPWLWPAARFDMNTRLPLAAIADVEASEAFSAGGWYMVRDDPDSEHLNGALFARMHDGPQGAGRGWELYWGSFGAAEGRGYLVVRLVSDPARLELQKSDDPLRQSLEENRKTGAPPLHGIMVVTRDSLPRNAWQHWFFTYDGSAKAAGIHLFVNGRPVATEVIGDSLRRNQTIRTDALTELGRRDDGEPLRQTRFQDIRFYRRALQPEEVARLPFEETAAEIVSHQPDPARWSADERFVVLQGFWLAQDNEVQQLVSQIATVDQRLEKLAPPSNPPKPLKTWRETVRDYNEGLLRRIRTRRNAKATVREDAPAKQLQDLLGQRPSSLIAQERHTPPYAHILKRGDYASRLQPVGADTPHFLPPLPADAPPDRVALANWLFTPQQPLFARVAVNRMWQEVFGQGLVESSGDFGVMGDRPSNPALLDWLAVEFRESGWDVKHLYKLMVMSAVYRQSAAVTPTLLEKDPANRLLARGPRFRMDAEAVRDSALAVAGLLVERMGGPPVKPYQPPGLWQEVAINDSNTSVYREDRGEDLYRRSLYTFWKRSSPPPNLDVFDAPSRESACPRRARADTPLQALTTMNDPQFLEAAHKLAARTLHDAQDAPARLARLSELTLSRSLDPGERDIVEKARAIYAREFQANPQAARALLAGDESTHDSAIDPIELAQWTLVASEFLNLDEYLNP